MALLTSSLFPVKKLFLFKALFGWLMQNGNNKSNKNTICATKIISDSHQLVNHQQEETELHIDRMVLLLYRWDDTCVVAEQVAVELSHVMDCCTVAWVTMSRENIYQSYTSLIND